MNEIRLFLGTNCGRTDCRQGQTGRETAKRRFLKLHLVRTVHGLALDGPSLRDILKELAGEARAWLADQADPRWLSGTEVNYHADMLLFVD